jgi:hypothetical protein
LWFERFSIKIGLTGIVLGTHFGKKGVCPASSPLYKNISAWKFKIEDARYCGCIFRKKS